MNEKIYVIIETDFDQMEILAATTNSGKAELMRRYFKNEYGEDYGTVEIYEFNEHEFDGLIFQGHHHFAVFMRLDGTVGNITDWGNSRMVVEPGLKECISDKEKENGCVYRFDCYAENQERAKALALIELQKYRSEKHGIGGGVWR